MWEVVKSRTRGTKEREKFEEMKMRIQRWKRKLKDEKGEEWRVEWRGGEEIIR